MMEYKIISNNKSLELLPSSPEFISVLEEIRDNNEIKKDKILVFRINEWGFPLYMILGIRLSLLFLREKSLNPIAIISDKTKEQLLESGRAFVELLLTPGIRVFSSIDEIQEMKSISINEYYKKFLPHIKVTSGEGSHSIANEWAAYNIGRLINNKNGEIPKSNDLLYLCYLLVNGMNEKQLESLVRPSAELVCKKEIKQLSVNIKGKILLIDDQNDIWENVIRNLVTNNKSNNNITLDVWGKNDIEFEENTNVVSQIKENKDYHKDLIKNYDVVLLDMRLAGKDEQHQDTEKLSGIQVLKRILDEKEDGNPGQRVIIFTSSNKAWNIKRCLEIGAQSIFIKESPMYPLQENERIENINSLLDDIQKGFNYSWLKDVCRYSKEICNSLCKKENVFYISIADQVKIATEFFLKADKDDNEKMRLAFISLENVFELMSQEWVSYKGYNPSDEYDDKIIKNKHVSERVIELIKDYKIASLDGYVESCIRRLITIRNKSIHKDPNVKEDSKWIVSRGRNWRLSKEDTTKCILMKEYVKSFRALMYLLYLIFVVKKLFKPCK